MGCYFGFVVERNYFWGTGGKLILPTILFVGGAFLDSMENSGIDMNFSDDLLGGSYILGSSEKDWEDNKLCF